MAEASPSTPQPAEAPQEAPQGPAPLIFKLDAREVAALLMREHALHEGFYELGLEFALTVGVFGLPPHPPAPGVMTTVTGVGLRPVPPPGLGPLTYDAAELNPRQSAKRPAARKRASPKSG